MAKNLNKTFNLNLIQNHQYLLLLNYIIPTTLVTSIVLSFPKFTENLYCIYLSIDLHYT